MQSTLAVIVKQVARRRHGIAACQVLRVTTRRPQSTTVADSSHRAHALPTAVPWLAHATTCNACDTSCQIQCCQLLETVTLFLPSRPAVNLASTDYALSNAASLRLTTFGNGHESLLASSALTPSFSARLYKSSQQRYRARTASWHFESSNLFFVRQSWIAQAGGVSLFGQR